jgi:16S rRNA (guanine527-N7)-methyltransferase
VDTLHARAEEAGQMTGRRAAYDLVLARSVARLPSLLEYMLPLARVGGKCIAMKGNTAAAEAADSKRALALLGGRLERIEAVQLPGVTDPHYLVVVEKVARTPAAYPRKPGTPTQKPLV